MIAIGASKPRAAAGPIVAAFAVAAASLLAAGAAVALQQVALGLALFVAVLALTLWRAEFGLYAALVLLMAFEPLVRDPIMYYGWLLQSDISSWSPLNFVNFTPIELLLLVTVARVVTGCIVEHKGIPPAQLRRPLLSLLALVLLSLGYGALRGGSINIALWETRSLLAGGLIALLVPALLPRTEDVNRLFSLLLVAAVALSAEIIWRRFVLLSNVPNAGLDLVFAHDTPTFLNFVVILSLARLIWPASSRQRLFVLAVPLILYAEMLTNRRAGWVGLDLGIILLAVFIFRLRRRMFVCLILPALFLYGGYLALAWNADGAWAEPARAVRSIDNPDARDAASNLYRYLEVADVRLNIKAHPMTGLGFGSEYAFYVPLPDLSWWPFWRYEAHNSVLWLWMEMGPIGFMAALGLIGAAIVRGVQLVRLATLSRHAPPLVALVSLLLMLTAYSYVDLGFVSARIDALLGLAVGVIGVWGRSPELLSEHAP